MKKAFKMTIENGLFVLGAFLCGVGISEGVSAVVWAETPSARITETAKLSYASLALIESTPGQRIAPPSVLLKPVNLVEIDLPAVATPPYRGAVTALVRVD